MYCDVVDKGNIKIGDTCILYGLYDLMHNSTIQSCLYASVYVHQYREMMEMLQVRSFRSLAMTAPRPPYVALHDSSVSRAC